MAILALWFGTNDSLIGEFGDERGDHRGLSIAEFSKNLLAIINLVRSPRSAHYSPGTKIILITPPPVIASRFNDGRGFPHLDDARTKAFAAKVREIGRGPGDLAVVDAWTAFDRAAMGNNGVTLESLIPDGVHPSPAGYQIVTELLISTIKLRWPEMDRDGLMYAFPPWRDMQKALVPLTENVQEGPASGPAEAHNV